MTGDVVKTASQTFAFGPFILIPERQQLLLHGISVHIGGRALDLLAALVERPGELVGKRELIARVWPEVVIGDDNLKVNMASLRRVLGEKPAQAEYIATVKGRGYRFIAPVTASVSPDLDGASRKHPFQKHNLPAVTTRIFGRSSIIETIRKDLDGSRLVSIVGPGGIGKTTVALAVAEGSIGLQNDGIWLVELAPLRDANLLPEAIATELGLAARSANALAALCGYLRSREMTIVLDSCEHIIDAVAYCADRILAAAGNVRILATSREPLRVQGERVRRLTGLDTPPASNNLTSDDALQFSAVQLFVDRATDRFETFSLSDADAPQLSAICRKLNGVALAIELAATHVEAFGVARLLDLLDDRFRGLKGHRAGPARHQTLTAMIDWSYDLLSAGEKAVFRLLATFAGPFTLESASAVAAGDGLDSGRVAEDLASLVGKSLVTAEIKDLEMEYRLYDTTRGYAWEKLVQSGEMETARRRHAVHFLAIAESGTADLERLSTVNWLVRYGAKIGDIRDALSWAFGSSHYALGLRLTIAAISFWERLSLVEECRIAVQQALRDEFSQYIGKREELILRVTLATTLVHTRGPVVEVKSVWTRAFELAIESGNEPLQLKCLEGLSEYAIWTGDSVSVFQIAERIRALGLTEYGISRDAVADTQVGTALRYTGDLVQASAFLERIVGPSQARATPQPTNFEMDRRLAARGSLALVRWMQGYPDQAVEIAARQRREAEASNHPVSICSALVHTSCPLALYLGEFDLADRLLNAIQNFSSEHHLLVWNAMATCLRAKWLLDQGNPAGLDVFRSALAELYEGGFRMRYPAYLAAYAQGLAEHGDVATAHVAIDEAIRLSSSSGQFWSMPELLRIKGHAFRAEGRSRSSQAAEQYLESIEWARKQGGLSWELRSATSLVELWESSGGDREAEEILRSVYNRIEEGAWTFDMRQASAAIGRAHGR